MSETKIRVLHFNRGQVFAGAEVHMLTVLRGLDRAVFQSFLTCHPELYKKMKTLLPTDVEVFPIKLEGPKNLGAALQFARILLDYRIGILHSHMFRSSLMASPIGWACRVPVIVETSHVAERWRKGWLKGRFWVDRLVSKFVTYHIAISQANANYLAQTKGLPRHKIVVIRYGCDSTQYAPDRPEPPGLRQALGFNDGDPVLLVPARLDPQKGHAVLLEALSIVLKEFPQLKVVLAGEGSLRKDLEGQTEELGLSPSIRFVGFQSKMADWYALADLMVLPSFFEGLPLVALESLASGCPVVATAVDGTPEVVVHGVTGLTVPPGDATQLAEAICHMFRHPETSASFARRGRELVESKFNLAKEVRETADLYRLAWNQRRRGFPLPTGKSVTAPSQEQAAARNNGERLP